jgi:hypothetical protein
VVRLLTGWEARVGSVRTCVRLSPHVKDPQDRHSPVYRFPHIPRLAAERAQRLVGRENFAR